MRGPEVHVRDLGGLHPKDNEKPLKASKSGTCQEEIRVSNRSGQ